MANNNGKRTFVEEYGNDGISDAEMVDVGSIYDTPVPEISDDQLIELGEELDRESLPLFQFDFQPVGQPKKALDIVKKQRGVAQKKQLRPATKSDNIGEEITRGVADMARRVIKKSKSPEGKELKETDRTQKEESVITTVVPRSYSGFLERSYFCDECNRDFDHDEFRAHPCEGRRCRAGKTIECGPKQHQPTLLWTHCNRHFYDNSYMSLHCDKGLCASWIRCGICCKEFKPDKKESHRCYWSECRNCKEVVDLRTHQCFIQHFNPNKDKPKKKSKSILKRQRKNNPDVSEYFHPPLKVWADFEAMLDEDGTHIPILIVAETSESDEVFEFYGPECTGDFLAFMDELAYGPPEENRHWDDFREVIGIFHDLKGYDAVFLHEQMVKENRRFEFLIPNGTKNLCMKVGKITFKDSMCFLPMALASFSSTFGIPELKKGFFPHKFHTPDHQNYIGPLPTAEYYDPDGMSSEKKKEFEAWYWRKCVMAPDSIAIEPENGWEGATPNHSHVSLEWLTWTERRLGTRIQHARQGGEYCIPHGSRVYTVDGYDAEMRTIYEFHGCLFNGCRDCFPKRNQVVFSSTDLTVEALQRQTTQKTATLQRLGYTVVEMWQCQREKEKKSDPDLRNFVQYLTFTTPLQPREAFFGGRTGATTLYHRIDPTQGEQIRYVDVTSEYPWVNKYGEYPIGHPTIYLEPTNQDPNAYYGLMKVSILPPTHLFNPVLPHRPKSGSATKLPFPLCRSCVEEESKKPMGARNFVCPHTDEERMLTGTWCTPEIEKAIEMGYQLIKIHEVWHFEKRQRGLFAPYVDTWLKIKQETALLDLLDDPLQQAQEVRILSPELVEVVAKRDDQYLEKGRATNAFIAAFTTCQSRLKLYESLEILKDRVLYYDTDSVVYKWRPGESEIALGDYLGDVTNELDEGDYIVEFISAGAKNYGYVTAHEKCCIKVKGFSLNVLGMLQLNYEIMEQNILDEIQHPLDESRKTEVINPVHFVRDPIKKKIGTETQIKS
ncbi:hypothetical protein AWC38_SpisGene10309 [Stylophora pistillata]|uniref:DNA-directed DNA polymerase n=1 Tax=Stylophora pistillata TaxID=50429 RepID=A0A2B4S913_STYPI|nr:hypothetical protein AWC38_SpisGene10309 [Stylophora pistillata]